MNRKRVLFVVTRRKHAGAQVQAVDSACALRAAGHQAQAWFLYSQEPAFENDPDVRVFAETEPRTVWGHLKIFVLLTRAMRAYSPDAVIGFLPLGNAFAALAGLLAGCGVRIGTQVNPPTAERRPLRWLDGLLGTTPLYTGNIAVSETVRQSYGKYPAAYLRKFQVIYPGVAPRNADAVSKAEARLRLGLPADAFVIGTVGRLEPQKNHTVLIDAAERVPALHVAIAGDGSRMAEYQARAAAAGVGDRVHFLGSLPPDKIGEFLKAMDCFAFPSAYEGFGIALIEAMAAGQACVVSDIPTFREIAAGVALTIDPTSSDAWAEALRRIAQDTDLRCRLAAAAAARADDFSLRRMVLAYEGLFGAKRGAAPGRR